MEMGALKKNYCPYKTRNEVRHQWFISVGRLKSRIMA
jgi:hypothetical protein